MANVENEGNEMEREENTNKNTNKWGLFPLVMAVVKETATPISDVYNFPITFFLYTSTYIIEENEKKLQEINKIQNKRK